jgi:hypothetical protein
MIHHQERIKHIPKEMEEPTFERKEKQWPRQIMQGEKGVFSIAHVLMDLNTLSRLNFGIRN